MDALDEDQLAALNQLRDLTAGADDEVSIGVLQSVEWDVERAAEMIFGAGGLPSAPPRTEPPTHNVVEQFELDDSEQGLLLPQDGSGRITRPVQTGAPGILAYIAYPFTLISSLFRFVFGVLRIPLPRLPFLSLTFLTPRRTPRRPPTGRAGADLWIRELEEETGAVCLSRARSMISTGVSSGVAGPSSLTSRAPAGLVDGYDGKLLPDFTLGSYEDTLRILRKEPRVGCIVLVSEEHDDTAAFKNSTLTDPGLISLFAQHDFLVWGGDVRDIEAFSASEKLQATAYPFVAFVAQQPHRGAFGASSNSRSNGTSSLTVLSRHQGADATTAANLSRHIEDTLLPRVTPYLTRIRTENQSLQQERLLRHQQDQAFAQAAQRDKERILKKMDEERQQRLQAERDAKLALQEQQQLEKEALQREKVRGERVRWRKWFSTTVAGQEPKSGIAIALKFPDGKRLVRRFTDKDTISALYAVVVGHILEAEGHNGSGQPAAADVKPGADLDVVITELLEADPGFWGFNLTTAYPRAAMHWAPNLLLKDVNGLKGGAQVVVDYVGTPVPSKTAKSEDGYDTESDEE